MNRKTKRGTPAPPIGRMLKVKCPACGYTARVSRKWLDYPGPPHCPDHGEMEVESAAT